MNTCSISSMKIQFFAYYFARVYEITEEERIRWLIVAT